MDVKHIRVEIIIAAKNNPIYLVSAFHQLFTLDFQPNIILLFELNGKGVFASKFFIHIFNSKLEANNILYQIYFSYNFIRSKLNKFK